MISNKALEESLQECNDIDFVKVEGDGYHYRLTIVSPIFEGKSLVQRQQWVYGKLKEYITTGALHAITMKTMTRNEWEKDNG